MEFDFLSLCKTDFFRGGYKLDPQQLGNEIVFTQNHFQI
jgi:hypothetical protein